MKEEILTAKEWIYKYNKENGYNYSNENCDYFIMEKYANYKNRILEDRIKEFGRLLKEEMTVDYDGGVDIFYIIDKNDTWHYHDIFKVFNKHFNIENKQ